VPVMAPRIAKTLLSIEPAEQACLLHLIQTDSGDVLAHVAAHLPRIFTAGVMSTR
jgi:hypothetical protein